LLPTRKRKRQYPKGLVGRGEGEERMKREKAKGRRKKRKKRRSQRCGETSDRILLGRRAQEEEGLSPVNTWAWDWDWA
jgi:hypothetical protein